MTDCENEVYTRIATTLREKFPGINIAGEYVHAPSSFPHVSIEMSDNPILTGNTTLEKQMVQPMFTINVYSNKESGKKTECKTIMRWIDYILFKMNFTRISVSPIPNLEDATIYRLVARYRVNTDGTNFYRG